MRNIMPIRFLLRLVLLLMSVINIAGCSESSFDLAPESRLPKWFLVPDGLSRGQLSVTMDYYVYPNGSKAVFKMYDKKTFFRLKKVTGIVRDLNPIELKSHPPGSSAHHPSYEVITVDGVTDIIEHREMKPIFHVTDAPAIWKELGVEKSKLEN